VDDLAATDQALVEVIGAWLRMEVPDDEHLVELMTDMAMSFRLGGASIQETCAWTRDLLGSWLHHPAHSSLGSHL